jgi:hypothetical protein
MDARSRNGCAWAGETFQETEASVETKAGSLFSARNGHTASQQLTADSCPYACELKAAGYKL